MKHYVFLSVLWLLSCFYTAAQDALFIISGIVKDAETEAPVPDVTIQIKGTNQGARTNDKGFFSFRTVYFPITLVTSHVSYQPREMEIREKGIRWVFIEINTLTTVLPTAEVTGIKKVENIVKNKPLEIWDYEFYEEDILLLAYYKGMQSIVKINAMGETLCTKSVRKAEHFYRDCSGTLHLFTGNEVFRLHCNETIIELRDSVSEEQFKRTASPCVEMHNGNYFLSIYYSNQQVLLYYYYSVSDSTKKELSLIADQKALVMLADRARFHSMGNTPSEADLRFEEMCFFKPVFAPLIEVNDTIRIFNFVDSRIESYNEKGEKISGVAVDFHHDKFWKEELLVDKGTGKAYALFRKNGITTIREIDMLTGLLLQPVVIPSFPFVEKIQIRNGYIYFLYKEKINNEYRQIYRMPL